MNSAHEHHRYHTDFDWDRRFMQNFCMYYKFVPLSLALVLNWLITFKSPSYSTVYRRSLTYYHISEFIFDIHHLILYVPYPLLPFPIFLCHGLLCQMGGSAALALTLSVTASVFASNSLFTLIFVRMRTILSVQARFRPSIKLSVMVLGATLVIALANIPIFAIFAQDSDNKSEILQRTQFAWVLEETPSALVIGDLFDLGRFNIVICWMGISMVHGIVFVPSILTYSAIWLARERRKLTHVKTETKDQATRILMVQLLGALLTFISPLCLLFGSLVIGLPTAHPHVHSVLRFFTIFLFLNNSMACFSVHLLMNRAYQKQIIASAQQLMHLIRRSVCLNTRKMSVASVGTIKTMRRLSLEPTTLM